MLMVVWVGCLSLLKSSMTSVVFEGPATGGGGIGGRGGRRGLGEGRLKSGPGGCCIFYRVSLGGHHGGCVGDALWDGVGKQKGETSVL